MHVPKVACSELRAIFSYLTSSLRGVLINKFHELRLLVSSLIRCFNVVYTACIFFQFKIFFPCTCRKSSLLSHSCYSAAAPTCYRLLQAIIFCLTLMGSYFFLSNNEMKCKLCCTSRFLFTLKVLIIYGDF